MALRASVRESGKGCAAFCKKPQRAAGDAFSRLR